jgi:hypothetical protein
MGMHGAVTKVCLPNQRSVVDSLGSSAPDLGPFRRFRFDSRRAGNRLAPPNIHPTLGFPTRPAPSTGVPIRATTACSHGLSRTPADAARRSGTDRSQLIIPWSQVRSLPGPPRNGSWDKREGEVEPVHLRERTGASQPARTAIGNQPARTVIGNQASQSVVGSQASQSVVGARRSQDCSEPGGQDGASAEPAVTVA